jgi:hypothetical protein
MAVAERTITSQEIQARREQNESVKGTLAMEGLTLDPVSAELGRRFDQGEITLAEFSAAMQEHVSKLALAARQAQTGVV